MKEVFVLAGDNEINIYYTDRDSFNIKYKAEKKIQDLYE
jgi:hypothetical protein